MPDRLRCSTEPHGLHGPSDGTTAPDGLSVAKTCNPLACQPHTEHGKRVARKAELRQHGIAVTKPSYAWQVWPSVISIPSWCKPVKGLPRDSRYVWLRRSAAVKLARLDRERGGRPMVLRAEYRICKICKRSLLGELAKARRMLDESCPAGDQLPCGPDCAAKHGRRKDRATA